MLKKLLEDESILLYEINFHCFLESYKLDVTTK